MSASRWVCVVALSSCSLITPLDELTQDASVDATNDVATNDVAIDAISDGGINDAPTDAVAMVECFDAATDSGLELYLNFDETSGDIVYDCSGYGRDGTMVTFDTGGGSRVPGKYGGGVFVSSEAGTGCVVDTLFPAFTSAFTVVAWVAVAEPPLMYGTIVSKTSNANFYGWRLATSLNNVYAFALGGVVDSGIDQIGGGLLDAGGTWHHVAATFDPSIGRISLYVDGALVSQKSNAPDASIATTGPLGVGCRDTTTNSYFDGIIDEVRVFSRVLSPVEIYNLP